MRIRFDFATVLLPSAYLGLALAGTSSALAQQVVRVDFEPAGLKALPAHVSGRVQSLPGGEMLRQWPGTYAETAMVGSEAYFRVGRGQVSLRVRVDDAAPIPLVKPSPGLYRISLSSAVAPHRIRVDVASESQGGATSFGGFFLPSGASAATLPTRAHQIEFIGDSHTVGYGNTSPSRDCTGDQVWEFTDSSVAVPPQVAARYDADYQVNAISGRGIVRNLDGFAADVLPSAYPFVLFDKATAARDPNWRPQAIVISLGTNDFATPLHEGEKWTRREQLQADFVAAYTSFVRGLHERNPQAYVLLWAAAGNDSELATQVRQVVQRVQQSGDTRIGFVPVPNLAASGCHYHPSVADDRVIAQAITRHLEANAPGLGAPAAMAAVATASAPSTASDAQAAANKPVGQLINDFKTSTWSVYGANQRTESLAQGGPKDYPMTRVTVSQKGNPWDAGASTPLSKPIKAGDTVLVAVYLRAPALKDGESTPVTYFGLNENSPPYTSVAQGSAQVTNQWKVYYSSGTAGKAFSPDHTVVGMHLAAAQHVLELGPVLVYNFGQNVDPAKLPH